MQPVELRQLRLELGDRCDLGVELAELLARAQRFGQLLVEPLKFLARNDDALLGNPQIAVQGERALAALDPLLPARLFFCQRLLCLGALAGRRGRRLARPGQAAGCLLALLLELRLRRQPRLEPIDFMPQRVAALANALLRNGELLVAQHAREKRRPLGAGRVGQHRELLLPGEIRVEELVVRHPQHALQSRGDFLEGIGDDGAVLVQLGIVQPALDAIPVTTEAEFELHADRGAGFGAHVANGVLVAARRGIAVDRPRDRFEQRRLAGAVRPDDAGDPVTEHDFGVGVLAEVDEPQAVQLHAGVPAPPASSLRAAASR